MQKKKIEMVPKVVRQFPQKKPVVNKTEENKGQLSRDILAGVSISLLAMPSYLLGEIAPNPRMVWKIGIKPPYAGFYKYAVKPPCSFKYGMKLPFLSR